jgi:peptidoglycan/LPS O-acetylase OafA/YrhL
MIAERSPRYRELGHHSESFLAFCRWSAALVVVLAHSRALSFVSYADVSPHWAALALAPLYLLSSMFGEAVMIFFVLSGFLVGGRAIERAIEGRFSVQDYAIDRATRIYCVLIPALMLTFILDFVGSHWFSMSRLYDAAPILKDRFTEPFRTAVNGQTLLCNVLSLQPYHCRVFGSNVPLWSLSYEVWFYIAAGAICFAVRRRQPGTIAAPIVAIALMVLALGWSAPVYSLFWIAGAGVYILSRRRLDWERWIVVLVTVTGAAGIVISSLFRQFVVVDGKSVELSYFATAFIFSVVLYFHTSWRTTTSERLLKVNMALSDLSFSLYITHFPVVALTLSVLTVLTGGAVGPVSGYQPTHFANLAAFGFAICLAIAVAFQFSRIFERGSLRVRRELKRKRNYRAAPGN